MSTIFDMINERPVTEYFFLITFASTLYFYIFKGRMSSCFFIPIYFISKGQFWRLLTSPFVCPDLINYILSLGCILYFGLKVEKKLDSAQYFQVLCYGHLILALISIIVSFIPNLPGALYPIIIGPSCLVVFLLQILAHVNTSYSIALKFDLSVKVLPYIAFLLYAAIDQICMGELCALILGYYFPDLFPQLVQKAPNDTQNMQYNPSGFWVKKPKPKTKSTWFSSSYFKGKSRSLND